MNIIAFSGSNSSSSINQKLVTFIASRLSAEVEVFQLTEYNLPMYSEDFEKDNGIPIEAYQLKNKIDQAKALIVSVNEHNSMVSAFFKNQMDWLSRIDAQFLAEKKVLLTSTSPGQRGAKSALNFVKDHYFKRFGAAVIEAFSFPSFTTNFDEQKQEITDEILALGFQDVITNFEQQI
ncbi:NADPH-dependent FMN reductase [Psychroflexus maritimus]|uniref:NAD(P)H-dependent oxidoreductase n=1 Tax=Psychroflexus maritimus TaxID=2714865 RepID=A0A967AAQ9_9FLAO|nr:NAD(P)H-dependent oxidoreductase [Psychroflexus maritimus]NGZ88772.1 NAD(P)H-dependent oxidoreductase [Psychroflexus maritimus]